MAEQPNLITDDAWQKRKCTKCGEFKFADGFGGETRQWHWNHCPDCKIADTRRNYRERHQKGDLGNKRQNAYRYRSVYRNRNIAMPPEITAVTRQAKRRWIHARNRYGISKIDWLVLYHKQGGLCAICRRERLTFSSDIEHNHATGKVRGLACHRCNMGMQYIDDPEWVALATAYRDRNL